ncbi:MAG: WxcM-like domain-containing protein [Candidatus Aureabacteria bacterium]|nr:WxcM-like domain-containing protein [Candidatus Auribacterota bacterium]
MIEGVKIFEYERYSDERGWLNEVWRSDVTGFHPEMGYVSMTLPGKSRGPHEHRKQTDYFIFMGTSEFLVKLWDRKKSIEDRIIAPEGKITVIMVPPGVVHGYRNTGRSGGLVLNIPDKLYGGKNRKYAVDEIRHEDSGCYTMD